MEDADDPANKALLRRSAEDLKDGLVKTIGTVFINNSRSHSTAAFRPKVRGAASSVRRLYALVAEDGAVLGKRAERATPQRGLVAPLEGQLSDPRAQRRVLRHA